MNPAERQLLLRPVRVDDLAALHQLLDGSQEQLTTLPRDPQHLEHKVHDSLRGFYPKIARPGGEYYLFVLEAWPTGEIIGTSGILARVGGFEPFYTYEQRVETFSYPPLEVEQELGVLHLKASHSGPSEICSLFLRADQRQGGLGRLLSLGRFLFMAQYPQRFDPEVIAEMRGWCDEKGNNPFWASVGYPFFRRDLYSADILSGLGNKEFIQALMPRHPIYVPLLPYSAQNVIGKVHRNTEPALHLLRSEGFEMSGEVDIFDAGPTVRAPIGSIRTVRERKILTVKVTESPPAPGKACLVARRQLDFRCLLASLPESWEGATPDHSISEDSISTGSISLTSAQAEALEVAAGSEVLVSPLKGAWPA